MNEYYGVIRSGVSLAHHGVKGQKWGVRRFQNKDGSLTAAGKKRYDAPTVIKKGNMLGNMSIGERKLTKKNMYAFGQQDVDFYTKDHVVGQYLTRDKAKDIRLNNFEVRKDLKLPSDDEAYDIFRTVAKKYGDSKYYNKKLSAEAYEGWINNTYEASKKDVMGKTAAFGQLYYNTKLNSAYFKALSRRGYNAVKDYEDIWWSSKWGVAVESGAQFPIIVSNGKKYLKSVSSHKIIPSQQLKLIGDGKARVYHALTFDGKDGPYYREAYDQVNIPPERYAKLKKEYGEGNFVTVNVRED